MTTIFIGTNRPDSNSSRIADVYLQSLERQGEEARMYSMVHLPPGFGEASNFGRWPESFEQVLNDFIRCADRFVFIVPEYNGSFPGILKVFLDTVDPGEWPGKRAALAGVATGRSGNQRGLDHLTAILHYLEVEVFSFKLFLSSIHRHLDEEGLLTHREYMDLIDLQVSRFLAF